MLISEENLPYPFANAGIVAQKYINPAISILNNCHAEMHLGMLTECPQFPIQEVRFHLVPRYHIRNRIASIFFNALQD